MSEGLAHRPSASEDNAGAAIPTLAVRTGLTRLNVALVAFGFAPLLLEFLGNLWNRPYYQYFPLALTGAVFLAVSRRRELPRPLVSGHGGVALVLLGGSFALLALGMVFVSPWLASVAAEVGLAGLAWWVGGWTLLRAMAPALAMGLTIIPPPLELDYNVMLYLRGVAVQWSSRVLDQLGVVHYLSGNVIELPRRQLLVEEACSGINSVLFTSAACLFYLLWQRRSLWRILICLPCVVAGVLLGNVIRITLGAWLSYHQIINLLDGWKHELMGLVLVVAYLILIPSLDRLLNFLSAPLRPKPAFSDMAVGTFPTVAATAPRIPAGRVAWLARLAACAFALVGTVAAVRDSQEIHYLVASRSALRAGATFSMPDQLGNWRRIDAAVPSHQVETEGIYSKIWHYQDGRTIASVALDYPFRGYHDVTICYRGNGWRITHQERQFGAGTNSHLPLMQVEMAREPASVGSLWFSTVDETGRWLEASEAGRNFTYRWQMRAGLEATSYRMQVLVTGYAPLPSAEREQAAELFQAARQILAQQVFDQLKPKS
jgi:exosortase